MTKGELKAMVVNFITGVRQAGAKANATLPDDFFNEGADEELILGDVRITIHVDVQR